MIKTTIKKLKNGLTIVLVEDKNKNQTTAVLTVKYGTKVSHVKVLDEIIEIKPGLAHLLEHTLIENSIYGNVSAYFNNNYVNYNGFTSSKTTYFPIKTIKDFKKHLKVLLDYINVIDFNEEKLEEIKKPIVDEIIRSKDRSYYKFNEVVSSMANNKTKFVGNLGEIDDVLKISVQELKRVHEIMYQPSNQILSISGNFDTDDILKYVEDLYNEYNIPVIEYQILDEEDTCEYERNEVTIIDEKYDPICSLEYKIDLRGFTKEERLKIDYYISYFFTYNFSDSSKTYKKVKDEHLSAFSFSCSKDFITRDVLLVRVVINSTEYDKIKSIIQDVFNNIYMDKEYFELWKRESLINIIKREKNHNLIRKSLTNNILDFDIYYNEGIDFIESMSYEEMKNLIERMDFSNYLFAKELKDVNE